MNFMTALEVAASGLRATRHRMNIISSNMANANSTRAADGTGPYRRKDPVFASSPMERPFGQVLSDSFSKDINGVEVVAVEQDSRPPRVIYDPTHPDANKDGMVELPNVNLIEEMVDMISASRAYESGVTAMSTIKQMANQALNIGR